MLGKKDGSWVELLAVFGGGCIGGLARYGLGLMLHDSSTLLGTTTVNLIGSFLLAYITFGVAVRLALPNWLILACGTGFVGAFTTFSTFASEAVLTMTTAPVRALVFMGVNLVGGFVMATIGFNLTRKWVRG